MEKLELDKALYTGKGVLPEFVNKVANYNQGLDIPVVAMICIPRKLPLLMFLPKQLQLVSKEASSELQYYHNMQLLTDNGFIHFMEGSMFLRAVA